MSNIGLIDWHQTYGEQVGMSFAEVQTRCSWRGAVDALGKLQHWQTFTSIGNGVGAQSTLGETFLPENYVWKINKMPEFYVLFARKIIKMAAFLWYLNENTCTKDDRILHILKYFPDFWGWWGMGVGGWWGHVLPSLPPSPTPHAYVH